MYSSTPMSNEPSAGRKLPSKSVVGAPVAVPAFRQGEVAVRCRPVPNNGLAEMFALAVMSESPFTPPMEVMFDVASSR